MKAVIAIERSLNSKIGEVSATYVSQASCPKDCPLYRNGCYAEAGLTAIQLSRLAQEGDPISIAVEEAAELDKLSGKKPCRLHVVGDCSTPEAARILAEAAARYTAKHGQPVWTYTHAWRVVPRSAWGSIRVWASCESESEIAEARAQGYYYIALVVEKHHSHKARYSRAGLHIPCPAQTRHKTCDKCTLCFRDLRYPTVVEFEVHGVRKKRVVEVIRKKGNAE